MLKEYIFRVTTRGYIRVGALNYEEASEWLDENIDKVEDPEVVDVELIDVEEQDVDDICDEMRLERSQTANGDF